jgi:hypothetical protein
LEPDVGGVLSPDHEVLARTTFRRLHDELGAYIVTNAPALVRQALRAPAGEPGIL